MMVNISHGVEEPSRVKEISVEAVENSRLSSR